MGDNIIQFPIHKVKARAAEAQADGKLFFFDSELAELTSTIPQAEPTAPRIRY